MDLLWYKRSFLLQVGSGLVSNTQNFLDCQQTNESDWLLMNLPFTMTQGSVFFLEARYLATHPFLVSHTVALKALSLLDISMSPPVYAATQPSCLFLWQWQQGNDSKQQLTCQVIEGWNDSSSVPVSSNFDFLCGLMSSYTNTHTHTHIHQNYKVSSVLD